MSEVGNSSSSEVGRHTSASVCLTIQEERAQNNNKAPMQQAAAREKICAAAHRDARLAPNQWRSLP